MGSYLNNNLSLTYIKKVSIWLNLDLSKAKSKFDYNSKIILVFFLIYLITGLCPKIKSSKDKCFLLIELNLYSRNLILFLEKFFIIYNSQKREQLNCKLNLDSNLMFFIIKDLSIFSELDGYLEFFYNIGFIFMDMEYSHSDNFRNFIFLDNC